MIKAMSRMSRKGDTIGIMVGTMPPLPFIQPDDPHMLLKEFALPPTVVQYAIRRSPI